MTDATRPSRIGRYRVLGALGAGGMGEVFLAEDERLGRRVALKRPKGTADASPGMLGRLQREARHIAQLSHPGIGSVYDIVDADGVSYIVMEYVEGDDLSVLLRNGPLPLDDALRIGIDIATALAAAHEQGIVHRDLKPGNVRITPDGQPKVLDFGLSRADSAKVPSQRPTSSGSLVTELGKFVGSPGYAAPEQVLGKAVDARTDIFSFGVLLYELVTGELPFGGSDPLSRAVATAIDVPRPARDRNSNLPAALNELLLQMLAKEPTERPASARVVVEALTAIRRGVRRGEVRVQAAPQARVPALWPARGFGRALVGGLTAVAVLVVALVAWIVLRPRSPAAEVGFAPPTPLPVVAVLAPSNLTGDPANDVLAVGFADSLVTDLSMLPDVAVIPPEETRQEEERTRGARQALARNLGASFVADSSIQQAGGQLRVNARLLSASGEVVWASDFAGTLDRIFDLQRQLSQGFVEGLQIRVRPQGRERLGVRTTRNVEALAESWRGRSLLEAGDLQSVEAAVSAFEAAVAKDPTFAEAFAGLGEAAWRAYELSKDPAWTERALTASERALALEPALPRVRLTLALVHDGTGHAEAALEDLAKAEEQLPNGDDVFRLRGQVLNRLKRTDEAIDAYRRAIELRPGFWRNHQALGVTLYRLGRFDQAIAAFKQSTELQPENPAGFQALGTAYHAQGDLEAARENYQRAIALGPSGTAYSNLGVILHWQGRYREAIAEYEKALELAPGRAARSHILRRNIGDAYVRLGERIRARQSYGIAASLAEQQLGVNNRDASLLAQLALYRVKLGEVGLARQHLTEALALAPDDADVRHVEAAIMALTGRPQEAWVAIQRAIALGTGLQTVEHDDDLETVRRLSQYAAWAPAQRKLPGR